MGRAKFKEGTLSPDALATLNRVDSPGNSRVEPAARRALLFELIVRRVWGVISGKSWKMLSRNEFDARTALFSVAATHSFAVAARTCARMKIDDSVHIAGFIVQHVLLCGSETPELDDLSRRYFTPAHRRVLEARAEACRAAIQDACSYLAECRSDMELGDPPALPTLALPERPEEGHGPPAAGLPHPVLNYPLNEFPTGLFLLASHAARGAQHGFLDGPWREMVEATCGTPLTSLPKHQSRTLLPEVFPLPPPLLFALPAGSPRREECTVVFQGVATVRGIPACMVLLRRWGERPHWNMAQLAALALDLEKEARASRRSTEHRAQRQLAVPSIITEEDIEDDDSAGESLQGDASNGRASPGLPRSVHLAPLWLSSPADFNAGEPTSQTVSDEEDEIDLAGNLSSDAEDEIVLDASPTTRDDCSTGEGGQHAVGSREATGEESTEEESAVEEEEEAEPDEGLSREVEVTAWWATRVSSLRLGHPADGSSQLPWFDSLLSIRPFVAGHRITAADALLCGAFFSAGFFPDDYPSIAMKERTHLSERMDNLRIHFPAVAAWLAKVWTEWSPQLLETHVRRTAFQALRREQATQTVLSALEKNGIEGARVALRRGAAALDVVHPAPSTPSPRGESPIHPGGTMLHALAARSFHPRHVGAVGDVVAQWMGQVGLRGVAESLRAGRLPLRNVCNTIAGRTVSASVAAWHATALGADSRKFARASRVGNGSSESESDGNVPVSLLLSSWVEARDAQGATALVAAAGAGARGGVRALLDLGVNVDAQDDDGRTALYWCACNGDTEALRALVQAGATLATRSTSGRSVLHKATWNGYSDIVHELVHAGANLDAIDNKRRTPLHNAAWGLPSGHVRTHRAACKRRAQLGRPDLDSEEEGEEEDTNEKGQRESQSATAAVKVCVRAEKHLSVARLACGRRESRRRLERTANVLLRGLDQKQKHQFIRPPKWVTQALRRLVFAAQGVRHLDDGHLSPEGGLGLHSEHVSMLELLLGGADLLARDWMGETTLSLACSTGAVLSAAVLFRWAASFAAAMLYYGKTAGVFGSSATGTASVVVSAQRSRIPPEEGSRLPSSSPRLFDNAKSNEKQKTLWQSPDAADHTQAWPELCRWLLIRLRQRHGRPPLILAARWGFTRVVLLLLLVATGGDPMENLSWIQNCASDHDNPVEVDLSDADEIILSSCDAAQSSAGDGADGECTALAVRSTGDDGSSESETESAHRGMRMVLVPSESGPGTAESTTGDDARDGPQVMLSVDAQARLGRVPAPLPPYLSVGPMVAAVNKEEDSSSVEYVSVVPASDASDAEPSLPRLRRVGSTVTYTYASSVASSVDDSKAAWARSGPSAERSNSGDKHDIGEDDDSTAFDLSIPRFEPPKDVPIRRKRDAQKAAPQLPDVQEEDQSEDDMTANGRERRETFGADSAGEESEAGVLDEALGGPPLPNSFVGHLTSCPLVWLQLAADMIAVEDSSGCTALCVAAARGHVRVVRALLAVARIAEERGCHVSNATVGCRRDVDGSESGHLSRSCSASGKLRREHVESQSRNEERDQSDGETTIFLGPEVDEDTIRLEDGDEDQVQDWERERATSTVRSAGSGASNPCGPTDPGTFSGPFQFIMAHRTALHNAAAIHYAVATQASGCVLALTEAGADVMATVRPTSAFLALSDGSDIGVDDAVVRSEENDKPGGSVTNPHRSAQGWVNSAVNRAHVSVVSALQVPSFPLSNESSHRQSSAGDEKPYASSKKSECEHAAYSWVLPEATPLWIAVIHGDVQSCRALVLAELSRDAAASEGGSADEHTAPRTVVSAIAALSPAGSPLRLAMSALALAPESTCLWLVGHMFGYGVLQAAEEDPTHRIGGRAPSKSFEPQQPPLTSISALHSPTALERALKRSENELEAKHTHVGEAVQHDTGSRSVIRRTRLGQVALPEVGAAYALAYAASVGGRPWEWIATLANLPPSSLVGVVEHEAKAIVFEQTWRQVVGERSTSDSVSVSSTGDGSGCDQKDGLTGVLGHALRWCSIPALIALAGEDTCSTPPTRWGTLAEATEAMTAAALAGNARAMGSVVHAEPRALFSPFRVSIPTSLHWLFRSDTYRRYASWKGSRIANVLLGVNSDTGEIVGEEGFSLDDDEELGLDGDDEHCNREGETGTADTSTFIHAVLSFLVLRACTARVRETLNQRDHGETVSLATSEDEMETEQEHECETPKEKSVTEVPEADAWAQHAVPRSLADSFANAMRTGFEENRKLDGRAHDRAEVVHQCVVALSEAVSSMSSLRGDVHRALCQTDSSGLTPVEAAIEAGQFTAASVLAGLAESCESASKSSNSNDDDLSSIGFSVHTLKSTDLRVSQEGRQAADPRAPAKPYALPRRASPSRASYTTVPVPCKCSMTLVRRLPWAEHCAVQRARSFRRQLGQGAAAIDLSASGSGSSSASSANDDVWLEAQPGPPEATLWATGPDVRGQSPGADPDPRPGDDPVIVVHAGIDETGRSDTQLHSGDEAHVSAWSWVRRGIGGLAGRVVQSMISPGDQAIRDANLRAEAGSSESFRQHASIAHSSPNSPASFASVVDAAVEKSSKVRTQGTSGQTAVLKTRQHQRLRDAGATISDVALWEQCMERTNQETHALARSAALWPGTKAVRVEFVDTERSLRTCAEECAGVPCLGVDVEYHAESVPAPTWLRARTQGKGGHGKEDASAGFVCLVQLSTPDCDYVVDVLSSDVRRAFGEVMGPLLTDPGVLKIAHGADTDLLWLLRDFGVRMGPVMDTYRAALALDEPPGQRGLAGLLRSRLGVRLRKEFQVADWRVRPLPTGMLRYARSDSRWLQPLASQLWREMLAADATRRSRIARGFAMDCTRLVATVSTPWFVMVDILSHAAQAEE